VGRSTNGMTVFPHHPIIPLFPYRHPSSIVTTDALRPFTDQEKRLFYSKDSFSSQSCTFSSTTHQVTCGPDKVARRSDKVTRASNKVARRPNKVTRASNKVARRSNKVTRRPNKVARSPNKVARASNKVTQSPNKVTRASNLVIRSPNRVSCGPDTMRESLKMSSI
jgi:hypothetical protein